MAGDIHLVPLSPQTVALLEQIHVLTGKFGLVFAGDAKPWKPMSENTVNSALRKMGYDTKTEICGHGFRSMACSALIESRLWSETAIERQMSHKAEFIEERRLIMNWWSRYLGRIVRSMSLHTNSQIKLGRMLLEKSQNVAQQTNRSSSSYSSDLITSLQIHPTRFFAFKLTPIHTDQVVKSVVTTDCLKPVTAHQIPRGVEEVWGNSFCRGS